MVSYLFIYVKYALTIVLRPSDLFDKTSFCPLAYHVKL